MSHSLGRDDEIIGTLVLVGVPELDNVERPWASFKRVIALYSTNEENKTPGFVIGLAPRALFRRVRSWADLHPPSRLFCVPNTQMNELLALKDKPQLLDDFFRKKDEWHAT